jgi:gamma-glutamylcyclotransferase (GGCT)/AIG2-like uncharacterized protein YtfP
MKNIWNFAFGSHLSKKQLAHIIGAEPTQFRRAVLPHHKLAFWKVVEAPQTFAELATEGSPALVPQSNSTIYGVVYLISEAQLKLLDDYEREWGYGLIRVQAQLEDGKILDAYAHNRLTPAEALPPNKAFQKLMLDGLREHGYDEPIIGEVKKTLLSFPHV